MTLFNGRNLSHFVIFKRITSTCRVASIRIATTGLTCRGCFRKFTASIDNSTYSKKHLHQFNVYNSFQRLTYASTSVIKASPRKELFPLRFVFIRTCVSLWVEYPEGVQFDVGYIDTKLQTDTVISDNKPVILGLPSSSGSHAELTGILMTFAKLGYRVVILNLPGSSFCRGKSKDDEAVFQMSVKEKAEFVFDFLRQQKIERVDMLITNSCSVYSGVELCVGHPAIFGSLVMINPPGLKPTKSMTPVWLHRGFTKVFDERFILQGLLKASVSLVKGFTKKKHWETSNIVTYSRTIAALLYADENIRAEYMKSRTTPRFAIFGADNDYLDVKSTVDYLSALGIPETAITEIGEKKNVTKQGEPFNGSYGIHLSGNSDDIKKSQTVLLRKELLKILKKICPDRL